MTEVITVGNNQLRGKRYGEDLFLAKLDAIGMRFFHLDPKVPFDPEGAPTQEAALQTTVLNFSLGASVKASLQDVDLFVVHPNHQIERLTIAEANEYAVRRPAKDVDLRAVHSGLFQGSILNVDVRVYQDRGQWVVVLNDDRKIVTDAPTKEDALELAEICIKARPSRPIPMPFSVLRDRRKRNKHFEPDPDENKIRGGYALKPHDTVEVVKGAPALQIGVRERAKVADVWQVKGERAVQVKLLFGNRPVTLYATHPNRLHDDEIALLSGMSKRIVVRRV